MGRKRTAKKGDWKPVRVKPEWLEMLREAHKRNPSFSSGVDLATASEPSLLQLACRVAASHISGWIWEQVDKDVQKIIQAERRDAILTVANHCGARVQTNADGTITVIARRKESPDVTLPTLGVPLPRPTMFN